MRIDNIRAVEPPEPSEGWTQPCYLGSASVERILQGRKVR